MTQPKLYGHRGARGERPENTMAAFHHAASLGLAGIETDIAMTADFIPVLHHDAALADGRLIKHLNAAELPPHVPTLAQALQTVPIPEWLLEIKTYPDQPAATHAPALMAAKTLEALQAVPAAQASILAFDWSVLRAVAALAPALPRFCLTAPATVSARALWWGPGFAGFTIPEAVAASGAKGKSASGAQGWAGFHAAITAAEIAQARALGLRVLVWTVNEPADFTRLAPLVDGIITDYPARFLAP